MGDHHQLSLLLLNLGGDAVHAYAQNVLALVGRVCSAASPGEVITTKPTHLCANLLLLGASQESGLLLGAVFRSVLLRELEECGGGLFVQALLRQS